MGLLSKIKADAQKSGSNKGKFIFFKEGEKKRIRFLHDMEEGIELLKRTSGAKFFDPEQNDVFPEKDFELCTRADCFDFVLRLNKSSSLPYMEKIMVK